MSIFRSANYQRPKSVYAVPGVLENVAAAKMGDTGAMLGLARVFRARVPGPALEVLDMYEAKRDSLAGFQAESWFKKVGEHGHNAMAYMMWLTRAAFYGSEEAKSLAQGLEFYKKYPYMSQNMLERQEFNPRNVWASSFLWDMGVADMDIRREDCSVIFLRSHGLYVFRFVSDHIPADREGFGAEYDYGYVYFDEFFNKLKARTLEDAAPEIERLEISRREYWAGPDRDRSRQYRTTAYREFLRERENDEQ